MASAVDTYSDLDISDDEDNSDLEELFQKAAKHLVTILSKLESAKVLELYGLYKQATVGPCNIERPSWYELQAKQKWEAWNALNDMKKETAKTKYIGLIRALDPDWGDPSSSSQQQATKQQWITVSTLNNPPVEGDSQDSVFDFCRKNDLEKVEEHLKANPKLINEIESGLGLIHWAVDRGHVEMVKLLLNNNCDVSMTDESGQTPLHYAATCGHLDCVTLLLEHGANKTLVDEDGTSPLDCAAAEVRHLLI